jgi:hypothetical protein
MHVSLPNTIPKTIPIIDLTESESSYSNQELAAKTRMNQ